MARRPSSKPTPAEVEILQILWNKGPSTVRDVCAILSRDRIIGYTGILKLMQNMLAKGSVRRRLDGRAHVYEADAPASNTKRQLVGEFVQRVFGGSASQLVLHLLEDEQASKEEIEEIQRMLAKHKRRSK